MRNVMPLISPLQRRWVDPIDGLRSIGVAKRQEATGLVGAPPALLAAYTAPVSVEMATGVTCDTATHLVVLRPTTLLSCHHWLTQAAFHRD